MLLDQKVIGMYRRYIITSYKNYKLNYWAIPKCANTSIKAILLNKKKKDPYHQNKWVHKNKNNPWIDFNNAMNNNFLNFSFTRNPYDRFLSLYKHFGLLEPFEPLRDKKVTFDYFVNFICNEYSNDNTCNYHARQQIYYITDNNLKVCVEKIYKLTEMDKFLKMYNLPNIISNKSKFENFDINDKHKEMIYKRYKKDFVMLNYKK